jgi:hypothetical protein
MYDLPHFEETKKDLYQEDSNSKQKTLCFDVENVLIRKVELTDLEQL